MGIPAFYRWLLERYPRSVEPAMEETPAVVNGVTVPIDTTGPNPNGYEFDNLYLDMNGIVHPCFHPEGLPPPKTYDDVFMAVFKYLDRIFSIIRPRKLLFMAIDGVAPRAKMNQQRARRFRAAKDAADVASGTENLRGIHESKGEDSSDTKILDSNVITPGTEFMAMLSSALQYYVQTRMNEDPGWKGIKVILSDASVPGEGEHKIISYIRLQRNLHGFDPNTRHCLYGLDADLIMLALATHEVHFTVLREDVRKAHSKDRGPKLVKHVRVAKCGKELEKFISQQKFQLLRIWVLRDYLAYDLQIPDSAVKIDLERLIDDFVFMCLFVGNDFLPHMPSLEISEGAIDLLMNVYKKEFVQMGGYLTNSVEVNLKRVEHFIQAVGSCENRIFKKRIQARKEWERPMRHHSTKSDTKGNQTKSHANFKTALEDDKVKLGEEGWKDRYYAEKFGVESVEDCDRVRRDTVLKYAEGICWVMHYYYQGVCSWQWFYPYHYAPFASDFHGFDQLDITFTLGKPFKPFDQLMGVLPAASAQALPLSYRKLMTDPLSPILDFYPPDFELDINGKRHSWQAVCKLPFIEESRLLSEIAKVENTLTDEEKKRNSLGLDMLFVHGSHPLGGKIFSFCERNKDNPKLTQTKVKRKINPKFSHGMNGYMYISDNPVCPIEIPSPINGMDMIRENNVICVFYKVPSFHPHITRLPEGVILPGKAIKKHDIKPPPMLWHEKTAITTGRVTVRPMPPKSISGSCLARLAHRLVLENLIVKGQGNGVNMALQAPLSDQTCPDDENLDKCSRKRKRNAEKRKAQHEQGNGVNMALQAPLSNQTCPDDENLDKFSRKRKRNAEKRKAQHERKRQKLKQLEDAIADPSQKSSIGPAVYACNNAPEQCTAISGKISGEISTCA
ncbi:5'-3' exoribonuclease 3-like isoform X1 [Ipomoea triloba]|uniref:5'-3' exoribonuclease 3-like isoform X1 n=2 Tax=Ipomoea triloba TaxID=35885 RepID=UPI00125E54DA|nr:5'-3' exoribonuclease 3-like isoform X1 [Ipomoea triloba]